MVRDPLSVIPSGLSLVTGVLDKRFGFWSLPDEMRTRYIQRLYKALVELLKRFHDDWISDRRDRPDGRHAYRLPGRQRGMRRRVGASHE